MATLVAIYEQAEDVAAALEKFREPVSDSASEITEVISRLYYISSATRKLDKACASPRNQRRKDLIYDDINNLLQSIRYTFGDINKSFGDLDQPRFLTLRDAYRGVWGNIIAHFKAESSDPLVRRLLFYSQSLSDFSEIVEGSPTIRIDEVREIRYRTGKILAEQNAGPRRLENEFGNMTVGGLAPKQRSFERVRPDPPRDPLRDELYGDLSAGPATDFELRADLLRREADLLWRDAEHRARAEGLRREYLEREASRRLREDRLLAEIPRRRRLEPRSPLAFPLDFEYDYGFPLYPEDTPSSPTTTTTETTTTSASTKSSNTSVITSDHWLPAVFNQSRPSTDFVTTGQVSACFGTPTPGARKQISKDYDQLLELPFESGELVVRLYVRESDRRARIHCKISYPGRPRTESTAYLTSLRITRLDSCLQLLEARPDRSLRLWAVLRFPGYERMILFYCAFLALKMQDEGKRLRALEDRELPGEELIFSAVIIDDSFRHVLKLYREEDSEGIRLQASAKSGDMKGVPVWTAFISYKIASRSWMRYDGGRKVHLKDLQRYVFSHDYFPTLSPGEAHELNFTSSQDATDFMDRIEDLAEQRI